MFPNFQPGNDWSHYEPTPPLVAHKKGGSAFTIDKATDGLVIDKTFQPRQADERDLGYLTGGYHYWREMVEAIRQARLHCEVNQNRVKVIDIEPAYNPTLTANASPGEIAVVQNHLYACCCEVGYRTGVSPLIYTNYNTWHYLLDEPSWGADFDLWVGSYPIPLKPTSLPLLPDTWKNKGWRIWQSSDHTDWFNGSPEELAAYFTGQTTAQPAQPTPSDKLEILWNDYLVRHPERPA